MLSARTENMDSLTDIFRLKVGKNRTISTCPMLKNVFETLIYFYYWYLCKTKGSCSTTPHLVIHSFNMGFGWGEVRHIVSKPCTLSTKNTCKRHSCCRSLPIYTVLVHTSIPINDHVTTCSSESFAVLQYSALILNLYLYLIQYYNKGND